MHFSPVFRRFLLLFAACFGLSGGWAVWQSFTPEIIYRKDFLQEYLLARAVLAGLNPYQPLPELAGQVGLKFPHAIFPHPTPHTPAAGLLSVPLGLVAYEQAAVIWLICQLACLGAAVWLLLRWQQGGRPDPWLVLGLTLLALNWWPVTAELIVGQVNLLLLVLLVRAWLALRAGRELSGGLALGGLLALKLMAWPVLIFLVLKRRWRAAAAAGGVLLAAQAAALAVLGWPVVRDYYLKVGPLVTAAYRYDDANYSAWVWAARIFEGIKPEVARTIVFPPLIAAPTLAQWGTIIAPLLVLVVGLALAWRARDFDASFGLLVLVSLLVNPVAWSHYLVLALLPATLTARWLAAGGWPKALTFSALTLFLLLSFPLTPGSALWRALALGNNTEGHLLVSFPAGLLVLLPALVVLGWLALIWWIAEQRIAPQNAALFREADCVSSPTVREGLGGLVARPPSRSGY